MIVLDASTVADFLLDGGERGGWATEQIIGADAMHAPDLIDLEVASVVRRRVLAGQIDAERGRDAIRDLADLRIRRHAAWPLLPRVWDLHPAIAPYDASYVALAEALDAPLVTADAALARACRSLVDVVTAHAR